MTLSENFQLLKRFRSESEKAVLDLQVLEDVDPGLGVIPEVQGEDSIQVLKMKAALITGKVIQVNQANLEDFDLGPGTMISSKKILT